MPVLPRFLLLLMATGFIVAMGSPRIEAIVFEGQRRGNGQQPP